MDLLGRKRRAERKAAEVERLALADARKADIQNRDAEQKRLRLNADRMARERADQLSRESREWATRELAAIKLGKRGWRPPTAWSVEQAVEAQLSKGVPWGAPEIRERVQRSVAKHSRAGENVLGVALNLTQTSAGGMKPGSWVVVLTDGFIFGSGSTSFFARPEEVHTDFDFTIEKDDATGAFRPECSWFIGCSSVSLSGSGDAGLLRNAVVSACHLQAALPPSASDAQTAPKLSVVGGSIGLICPYWIPNPPEGPWNKDNGVIVTGIPDGVYTLVERHDKGAHSYELAIRHTPIVQTEEVGSLWVAISLVVLAAVGELAQWPGGEFDSDLAVPGLRRAEYSFDYQGACEASLGQDRMGTLGPQRGVACRVEQGQYPIELDLDAASLPVNVRLRDEWPIEYDHEGNVIS